MEELQPSESRPGRWCIGSRALQDGDLIEIYDGSRWHVARYEYKLALRAYQLKVDGRNTGIVAGTPARMFTRLSSV
ncbi:MAG: hypothetical protein M1434_00255 [Chloroflexi bacterium]|nr:hypothetical protein [Chloroflexota bacterium]MCL5273166.1 hypothetical protein [Chloroflexota bacterium]